MKKLKFPILKETVLEPKALSMDEYLRFVNFNLRYTTDKAACREQKRAQAVNIRFKLK